MTRKLLFTLLGFALFGTTYAQTISIIGDTSPSGSWSVDTYLSTTDNITYTLNGAVLTTATGLSTGLKFRQDGAWTTNWGGNTFPNGVGQLGGNNIQTVAGTYNITFNRINGTYTFIQTAGFPSVGIWGPAVDSQNGYGGPDVDMITSDGITYTLSGFNFSSGNAYFRQDNNPTLVWGSTSFPTGTAVSSGPSLSIPGGEWFVTFNRITGEYTFEYPIISIMGTAALGWDNDLEMVTTNGFNYQIDYPNGFTIGELKFRKNRSWDTNWGGNSFPTGIGVLNGNNVVVSVAGLNYATFDRISGEYNFVGLLQNNSYDYNESLYSFPNPSNSFWVIQSNQFIEKIEVLDFSGKTIHFSEPKTSNCTVDASLLNNGLYIAKITTNNGVKTLKLAKN